MNPPNIKIYLAISGILIVLFIVITFYPFGKKINTNQQPLNTNFPTPTSIKTNKPPKTNYQSPTIKPVDFTGVAEEEIPPQVYDAALQKQELKNQVPFDTGLFKIDFDYSEDKFIITLAEPKGENRIQFDKWLKENYPLLTTNQFNFK